MKQVDVIGEKDGYILRLARREDAEHYYRQNYEPLDPQVVRYTGCKKYFSRDEVVDFFLRCVEDEERYDFMILAPDGKIIGESVINEIDWSVKSANFRIAIFHPGERGRGIGSWAVKKTRDFAFEHLGLHRLELDVFSFNPCAEKAYRAAGFRREGILKDAILDGEDYADDILMALLEDEWRIVRETEKNRCN